jgi:hypothetical protein
VVIWLALAAVAAAGAWGVRRVWDRRQYAHEATESVR